LGASRVCLGPGCADPFSRKALRASMACALGIPIVPLAGLGELVLARGRGQAGAFSGDPADGSHGYNGVVGPGTAYGGPGLVDIGLGKAAIRGGLANATVPGETGNLLAAAAIVPGAIAPAAIAATGRYVSLVLGNEGWGLPTDVVAACDAAVAVPMAGNVDSLNVGAAGAILMWELFGKACS
jgi:hypothetical protein